MNLTLKDKLQLNRKAKAHGLPALWPEAEEEAKKEREREGRALRAEAVLQLQESRSLYFLAQQMEAAHHPPFGGWQGGVIGPLHGLQNDPNPGAAYGSPWGTGGAYGDPRQMFPLGRPGWPEPEELWAGSLLSDVRDALRSLFSHFRGPRPW